MTELAEMFANVGFPIAVSFYLLARVETKMTKLDDTIQNLSVAIEKLCYRENQP